MERTKHRASIYIHKSISPSFIPSHNPSSSPPSLTSLLHPFFPHSLLSPIFLSPLSSLPSNIPSSLTLSHLPSSSPSSLTLPSPPLPYLSSSPSHLPSSSHFFSLPSTNFISLPPISNLPLPTPLFLDLFFPASLTSGKAWKSLVKDSVWWVVLLWSLSWPYLRLARRLRFSCHRSRWPSSQASSSPKNSRVSFFTYLQVRYGVRV